MLGSVGTTIQTFFNGSLTDFFNQNSRIFDDIATLLNQQLSTLPQPAQTVIKVLVNHLIFAVVIAYFIYNLNK